MKAYQVYKDTGHGWASHIPATWKMMQLKFLTENHDGKRVPVKSEDRGDMQGEYPYYGANGIIDYVNDYLFDGEYLLVGEDGAPFFLPQDVAFVASGKFWVNNHAHILKTINESDVRFLKYSLNTVDYREYITGSTRDKLTQSDLSRIKLPIPTLPEQQAIADFLDRKTAQIDTLIEKKQRQIDLLQEQRTALINHAVTKGLNPDVRMKDSGVEWLGEIPSHWTIKPLKHIKAQEENSFVDGPFGSNLKTEHFVEGGDVFVIESGFVTTGQFVTGEYKTITKEHFETIKRSECRAGDIVIAKIGARFGTSGILPELGKPCVVSGNSLKLTVNVLENSTEFIHFSLLSLKRVGAAFELIVNATAQPALSLGRMNEMKLAVPPKPEQEEIVKYIKSKSEKMDEAEDKISRHISLLQEYRTALISEAVTGKIDVRTAETVHE